MSQFEWQPNADFIKVGRQTTPLSTVGLLPCSHTCTTFCSLRSPQLYVASSCVHPGHTTQDLRDTKAETGVLPPKGHTFFAFCFLLLKPSGASWVMATLELISSQSPPPRNPQSPQMGHSPLAVLAVKPSRERAQDPGLLALRKPTWSISRTLCDL